jgi:hypothetical protein
MPIQVIKGATALANTFRLGCQTRELMAEGEQKYCQRSSLRSVSSGDTEATRHRTTGRSVKFDHRHAHALSVKANFWLLTFGIKKSPVIIVGNRYGNL